MHVPVAQMDRASASEAEGRAFESPQARSFFLMDVHVNLTARNLISTIFKDYVNIN